jgi:heme-degrading monooxygenase HmoA
MGSLAGGTRLRELEVHARVSTYEGDVDALVAGFARQTDLVRRLDGFVRAYLLVDRAADRAIVVALWESEGALAASAERAAHLRQEASEAAGGAVGSVESYEVALEVAG